jgi:hypothetical protein
MIAEKRSQVNRAFSALGFFDSIAWGVALHVQRQRRGLILAWGIAPGKIVFRRIKR